VNKFIKKITFNKDGLVPIIVQDYVNNKVLMMAWANKTAINMTLKTNIMHYWSRSRQKLWKKGESSGNLQYLKNIYLDCDSDSILVQVIQKNNKACHTGQETCFFNEYKY